MNLNNAGEKRIYRNEEIREKARQDVKSKIEAESKKKKAKKEQIKEFGIGFLTLLTMYLLYKLFEPLLK